MPADATLFRDLLAAFEVPHDELKDLKSVLAAQWALESNWGRTKLAELHYNFSGIEWIKDAQGRGLLSDIAGEVSHPTNPEKGNYCRLLSLAGFIKGYGLRLERDPNLSNWRAHVGSADAFIQFLAQKWRPTDADYAEKVGRLHKELASGGGPGPVTDDDTEPQLSGFVIRIDRRHAERRPGRSERTVGRYKALFNGVAIPGLSGSVYEFRGPGDNGAAGVQNRRIREGVYSLFTHLGTDTWEAS